MFQKLIRKTLVLLFVILAVAGFGKLTQAQVCQPTTNNLVSWYRGEGNAQDAQAVNNGTLQNGTSFAPGKIGQGFKFDGADDFVEIPDAASLRPQQLTLEAWVKFDDLSSTVTGNAPPGFQYIVFKKNANQLLFEGYSLIKLPGNRLAYSNSSNGGVQTTIVDNTQTVEVGKFYHVVGTYDGATARLYVNGRKVAEASHNLPLDLGTRPLVIGGTNETNWDGKMNGVIDDVKIYNRALNDTEIFSNYRTGSSLIVNCDAEADQTAAGSGSTNHDVSGWNNENGEFTVVRYASTGGSYPTTTDPGPDGRGAFFFSGGQTATSSASQIINVSAYAAPIDFRIQKYNLSGYLGGFANQADNARVTATFRDAANNPIGSAVIGPVTPADRNGVTSLLSRSASGILPIGTRSVKIALLFTRFEGTFNDGYADNLSFTLNQAAEISTNLAAWHGGDGDARDFLGFSNGNLINTPRFVVGKVGQALRFQNGSHVQINSNGIFRGRTEGTIEAWIKPSALPNGEFNASGIWVESESTRNFTRLGLYYLTSGQVGVYANNSQVFATSPTAVPLNAWTHVAGTYKAGETAKLYVNGVLVSESAGIGSV